MPILFSSLECIFGSSIFMHAEENGQETCYEKREKTHRKENSCRPNMTVATDVFIDLGYVVQ